MATELIINASLPETRIALTENGEIQDLLIERATGKGIVGNIYKGRVTRVLPGMQAAFVDIGLEKAAFLYVDDVFVHSEIWEEEEGASRGRGPISELHEGGDVSAAPGQEREQNLPERQEVSPTGEGASEAPAEEATHAREAQADEITEAHEHEHENEPALDEEVEYGEDLEIDEEDDEESEDEEDHEPAEMAPPPGGDDDDNQGMVSPSQAPPAPASQGEGQQQASGGEQGEGQGGGREGGRRRHRRGRRGGRYRRRDKEKPIQAGAQGAPAEGGSEDYPDTYRDQVADEGAVDSDRATLGEQEASAQTEGQAMPEGGRPETSREGGQERRGQAPAGRAEFRAQRGRDRRIKSKASLRPPRGQVNIQDLLKEGQEVIVQVAKDPIATKGARLTCHISLPGRHLVCMPTIDHVGVSRRIERDDERRKLRDFVERNRPRNLGFIVRTASGRGQSERRIKQDIDYLTHLWEEIREKAGNVTAPALVYEDLNSTLRAIRDWVTEDIDKIIVDSRYHYNDILKFVSHFMPSLKQKVELYHGDIPIFDAYGISTELSRALERKVWLKSGGYLVIDQAEALVAIDVNTGRYVGKKNLEDTILKTNLEAVQEIAYQLRLRNCGGIIILDLIDMEKEENKKRVYHALEEALKKDRARPTILKISELGLVEMTRKRTRDTMVRAQCESCAHCEGKGFIKSKVTVAYEAMREIEREGMERDTSKVLVQAHPGVIDILAIDERDTLDHLERRYRKQIYLQAVDDFHPEQFEVTAEKREGARPSASVERSERQERQDRHDRHERGEGRSRRGRDRDRGRRDQGRDRPKPEVRPILASGAMARDQAEREAAENRQGGGEEAGFQQQALEDGANTGNVAREGAPSVADAAGSTGGQQGAPTGPSPGASDDFYDEEDRLAFLRAQAAQDAALARLRSSEAPAAGRGPRDPQGGGRGPRDSQGGGGGGSGRRGKRGRRGGKFRGGGRDRDRGPRQLGVRDQQGSARTDNDSDRGDSDASSTPPSGGHGDHSQPS